MTPHIRRSLITALAAVLIANTAFAADHACCPRSAPSTQVKVQVVRASIIAAHSFKVAPWLQQLTSVQPDAFMQTVFTLNTAAEPHEAPNCSFMHFIRDWKAWRVRNPNATSRYPGLNSGAAHNRMEALHLDALNFGPSPQDMCDFMDCEPSFSVYGPCGCDLAFAMSSQGCGWFHSQVGNIQFIEKK